MMVAAQRTPGHAVSDDYLGKTLDEIVAMLGVAPRVALSRLCSHGYRRGPDGRYIRNPPALEVEDRISQRIAACPPAAPCFRCGCRLCACADRARA